MCRKKATAMVFEEVQMPFASHHIDLPTLSQGEALVRVTYTTICSSDVHSYLGRRPTPCPSILGHEIIGRIEQLAGPMGDFHGDRLAPGDRITWTVYACQPEGEMARRGHPQKSPDLYKYGHEQLDHRQLLSGGFSTHCHLKEGTAIFSLPDHLSDREAAPLNCTHATIAGGLRLAGSLAGKRVLVSGAGMLGLSACAMASEAGASQVWALDLLEPRRRQATAFGASEAFAGQATEQALQETLRARGGVDVLLETSGAPEAIEKTLPLLNIGGTAILIGSVYPQRPISVSAEWVVRNLITIKGLHNYVPKDLAYAIRFVADYHRKYDFQSLVSADYPLAQLGEAFVTAQQSSHYRVGIRTED